jgi:hypothetical protein
MKVSFFETARYLAPEPFRPEWSVPSGADDRGAGAQAYQGMIERLGTPAEVRQRREELVFSSGLAMRQVINVAGLPSVAVPIGFGEAGLPLSMQIVGPAWGEAHVLRIAHRHG